MQTYRYVHIYRYSIHYGSLHRISMYVHEEGRASCAQSEWMASCVARMADADDGQQVFATWRNGRERPRAPAAHSCCCPSMTWLMHHAQDETVGLHVHTVHVRVDDAGPALEATWAWGTQQQILQSAKLIPYQKNEIRPSRFCRARHRR